MVMNNRQLLAMSQALQGQSAADVDAVLREKHLDPQERLAVKVQIDAAAATQGRTVKAGVTLASDGARPLSEMDRLLRRAGLRQDQTYTEAEIEAAARGADLTEPQTRLALKIECASRGMIGVGLDPQASEADRLLRNLGISGPVDLEAIEQKMDQLGWGVTAKTVVKSECQRRGWLKHPGNLRSMRASAARGTRLVDQRGRPISLKSIPD
jgi:hypothetical protein